MNCYRQLKFQVLHETQFSGKEISKMKLFSDRREAKMYCFSVYVLRIRSLINNAQMLEVQDLKF